MSPFDLESLIGVLAEAIVARLQAPPAATRIALADVAEHGAPSARWLTDKARQGLIEIKGPRGARYVDRGALDALLGSTSIRRKRRAPAPRDESGIDVVADARAAVAELAAKRSGGAR